MKLVEVPEKTVEAEAPVHGRSRPRDELVANEHCLLTSPSVYPVEARIQTEHLAMCLMKRRVWRVMSSHRHEAASQRKFTCDLGPLELQVVRCTETSKCLRRNKQLKSRVHFGEGFEAISKELADFFRDANRGAFRQSRLFATW